MPQPPVLLSTDARGVATITLNRPEVGNAYNAAMLDGLIEGLTSLRADPVVRCLVLRGAGKHFQAGADIRWLGEVAHYPPSENYAASLATTRAMQLLNEFPKPTIAIVHGACFGGGVDLVCCADVAFATPDAQFGITEIHVGVAPTPISTHLVNAIGLRHTRRYALTGERFDAGEAERIGLITKSCLRMPWRKNWPAFSKRYFWAARPRSQQPKAASLGPTTYCWMSAGSPCWRTRGGRSAPRWRGSKAPPPSGRSASRHGTIPFTPTCG
jgi:enoyl-CoA hydratase/carnithine racemase